jgi:hypothetical protein
MADRKISDLTALTTPASGDFLPIVDISEAAAASKNKRITIEELFRGVPLGTAAAPSIAIEGDEDTGVFSPGANQLAISTNGVERVEFGTGEVVFNDGGANYDFRIEGDTNANLFFVDASTDRVGLGTSSPSARLTIADTTTPYIRIERPGVTTWQIQNNQISTETGFSVNNITSSTTPFFIGESGRVGIGTTSPGVALHVDGDIRCDGVYGETDTNTSIQFPGSDVITFNEGGSEAARIDSSARLLVGTSTARSNLGGGGQSARLQIEGASGDTARISQIQNGNNANAIQYIFAKSRGTAVGSNTIVQSGDNIGQLSFEGSDGTNFVLAASIIGAVDGTPGANDMPGRLVLSTTADGASSPTERVKIASNGITYIGNTTITTSSQQTTAPHAIIYSNGSSNLLAAGGLECNTTSTSARHHISFTNPNGVVGSISTSASATAYNTSSDYRLKENVVPLTGAADRLNQLQVHRFNFIADSGRTVDGFIAHEAQAVVPECVTGTKDEVDNDGNPVYQGIDQAKLVPLLTAALQEAIAEIASLKDRVAALEGE